jgi:hypothetical protein
MKINRKLSRELTKLLGAEDKLCFQNALRAASYLEGAIYVEGYCVTSKLRLVCDHGWVEYEGQIIDTTPVYQGVAADSHYFPADRYDMEARCKAVLKNKHIPFMALDHLKLPQYQKAYVGAMTLAYGAATTRTLLGRFEWYKQYATQPTKRRQRAKR